MQPRAVAVRARIGRVVLGDGTAQLRGACAADVAWGASDQKQLEAITRYHKAGTLGDSQDIDFALGGSAIG